MNTELIEQHIAKRVDLDERVAAMPIIRELRDLGIGTDLVARKLDISPVTCATYMTGKKELPVKHIPVLMRVLDTSIKSWKQMIKEWRSAPMAPEWEWRVNRYEDMVNHCTEQLALYQAVWHRGPRED